MDADSGTAYAVYLGAWTDWSKGHVLGATYTLTRQNGNLLIAFLAFFMALVGTRFWRLACLLYQYFYSKDGPSDAAHHPRQVLRDAPNPEAALWAEADMEDTSWKHNAKAIWIRLLPLFGVAVASFAGFAIAGGFSSRVATIVSSEVLLSGVNCSFIRNDGNISNFGNTEGPLVSGKMAEAETYARQCYKPGTVGVSCGTYVKKRLVPAVLDTNATCPFDAKVCKSETGNLFIDTGLLDSHHDLGRNTPPNRRLQLRKVLQCAPLATDGYRFRTYDGATKQSYTTYYYGGMRNVNGTFRNYTEQYLSDSYPTVEELTHRAEDTMHDFSVRLHFGYYWNASFEVNGSSFVPIPEFKHENFTLNLFFLSSNRVLFTLPSTDSWYGETTNTTQVYKTTVSDWGNTTMYRQAEPGAPLACTEQEQYCYTGSSGQSKCSALEGGGDAMHHLFELLERNDSDWLWYLLRQTFMTTKGIADPLLMLGTRALMARDHLNGPLIGSLPDNQWQREVLHWHATVMAHIQLTFLESPIGYEDQPQLAGLKVYPNSTTERELCDNQKIRAEGFVSVSIFGLACIFLGGSLIIVLSFSLNPLLAWYLDRIGRYQYAKLPRSTTDALQLQQRVAQEDPEGQEGQGSSSGSEIDHRFSSEDDDDDGKL